MDCCLIASGWSDPGLWFAGFEVAIGLGFVIFVHELGHFVVAKMCGVKCEKFMIGFDIGGIRLLSFRRGETLYGVGILPLGGYVKMLGQEDNPAQLRKEMERARGEGAAASSPPEGGTTSAGEGQEASVETKLYNPRSFLAKSVPQRMAIISAGVIMNMIFAFFFAVAAYMFGVKDRPTVVGGVVAGGAAWQAGIRMDDVIVEVAGRKVHDFEKMTRQVVNGDLEHGVPLVVQRPGVEKPLEFNVKPQELGGRPTIGIISSQELQISKTKGLPPFLPDSAAERADKPFMPGDRIVKVDGHPVKTYGQLQDYLITCADKPIAVTVARAKDASGKDDKWADTEEVTINVPAGPMKQFGFSMEMGSIAAIQVDSPAAEAGIQPGDLLTAVNGKPAGDPLRLPDEFHKLAGTEVVLGLQRDGKPLERKVKLSSLSRNVQPHMPDSPVALTELGAAYFVRNIVAAVEPDGPAAKAGLQPGDRLTSAKITGPSAEQIKELRAKYHDESLTAGEVTLPFEDRERNWPYFILKMQEALPGTTLEFTWQRDKKEMTGKASPAPATDWYNPERGWDLEPMVQIEKADSFADALAMGWHETVDSTLFVYRMLHSVSTNKISVRMISGPVGIIGQALMIAQMGFGNLLAFLTILSANLAVINFLPIPVLDGGHMVLLAYEGIRGKPADERVQEVITWIGLILLLTLMVWAFGLDLGLFSRPGAH